MAKQQNNFTVAITHTVTAERLEDLIVNSCEGGSNYWATFKSNQDNPYDFNAEGWELEVFDFEENETHKINLTTLQTGLQKMIEIVPHHFTAFQNEDDDAWTADCFMQCCVFGDVIYG